jgi:HlyD family secretion protein
VLAGLFAAFGLNRSTEAQHFTARVELGDIHDVVEATGTLNAVITVQVGSQVSGTIAKLNVDFNSRVHKGDIVALIDPALFQGALLQASADVDNAKANVVAAKANLEKTKATLLQTKADYDRTALLTTDKITSQQQLDLAKANYDSANAAVGAAAANVTQAEAQASQKAAALTVAQTNLNYTVIRSPIDGTVVARNVDVGQTVAASLQAPTIFTIARLTKMLVYTKTDESRRGQHQTGEAGHIQSGCFPKGHFMRSPSPDEPNHCKSVVTTTRLIELQSQLAYPKRLQPFCGYCSECVKGAEYRSSLCRPWGRRRFSPSTNMGLKEAERQLAGDEAPLWRDVPAGRRENQNPLARRERECSVKLHVTIPWSPRRRGE